MAKLCFVSIDKFDEEVFDKLIEIKENEDKIYDEIKTSLAQLSTIYQTRDIVGNEIVINTSLRNFPFKISTDGHIPDWGTSQIIKKTTAGGSNSITINPFAVASDADQKIKIFPDIDNYLNEFSREIYKQANGPLEETFATIKNELMN